MKAKLKLFNIGIFIFCVLYIVAGKSYIYGFDDKSHKTLTQLAINTTNMLSIFPDDIKGRIECEMLNASTIPDKEEIGFLFKPHFYNPDTRIIGVENDSAFSNVYFHFRNGVQNWNINKLTSMRELGMALHYMQDMCCIVHLHGYIDNMLHIGEHLAYEKAMDQKCSEYAVKIRMLEFEKGACNFREVFDIAGVAAYSGKLLGEYRNGKIDLKTPTFDQFKMTHQACCELIYLFFKEVNISL